MASIWRDREYQFQADDGTPLNAGTVQFYTTGTSTPKNTYSDEALTTPNANPIVLEADGRSANNIWISGRYRVVVKTAAGATIADIDPVEDSVGASDAQDSSPTYGGNNSGTANALVFTFSPAITATGPGQILRGRILADNSTAVTVNWGPGVKSLVKQDGAALAPGDLQGPGIIEWSYDATTDVARLTSPDGHLFRNGGNEPGMVDITDGATLVLTPATINSRYARAITSTTTVTAITLPDGNVCKVRFNTARTLTHGASLILPGGVNITTAAGDLAEFVGEAAGVVRCTQYLRAANGADGLLATTTASAASQMDFVLPAGFRYYELVFDATFGTDGATLYLRISQDGGATFKSGAGEYEYETVETTGGVATPIASAGNTRIEISNTVGSAAAEGVDGQVWINNPASATRNKLIRFWTSNYDNAGTSVLRNLQGTGSYNADQAAINALRLIPSGGTITGTGKLYGRA